MRNVSGAGAQQSALASGLAGVANAVRARRSPQPGVLVTPKQHKRTRRRPVVSSYPVPAPEAVTALQKKLFTGRFVDEHLSALLGRASAVISAEFHQDVRRHRMPVPQWRVMAALFEGRGMSLSELSELTLINQPTITRLVQRLEAAGFLRKASDLGDRRAVRVSLTKRGHEKVRELIALAKARQKRILQGLDEEKLKASLHYLIAFCAAKRRS
jgi:MarR family transcriptional regulator, organic hydroperoxide resistance regulator